MHIFAHQASGTELYSSVLNFALPELICLSVPYKVLVRANGEEVAQRTSDVVLHLEGIDLGLRLPNPDNRALAVQQMCENYRRCIGRALPVDQVPTCEVVEWRNECIQQQIRECQAEAQSQKQESRTSRRGGSLFSRAKNMPPAQQATPAKPSKVVKSLLSGESR